MAIKYRFVVKRDPASSFTLKNTLLLDGEFGLETDTGLMKMGNGVTPWNSLPYSVSGRIDMAGVSDGDAIVWDSGTGGWKVSPITSPSASAGGEILVTGAPGPVALTTNDTTDWLYT